MRVAITGSAGLIGGALAESLTAAGDSVLRLVRRPPAGAEELRWDPAAPAGGIPPAALSGVDAVVHLAGAPIAAGRWSDTRKKELRDSRVAGTAAIVAAMLATATPPPVLVAGSAVGWYGDTGDRAVDESVPAGDDFLATLVRHWEAATEPAAEAGIRVVRLRSGVVLSRSGGMLPRMLLPFRLGLGARFGAGTQYLSWIALADHLRAVRFVLEHAEVAGPANLTSPEPVTNAGLTRALAAAVHRPAVLAVPAGLLRLALGELSTELLSSCRALPARLQEAGFEFRYPAIRPALDVALAERGAG